jgi:hypothetical protein
MSIEIFRQATADFTPDQLKLIGGLVVTFGGAFITLVWNVAAWKTKIENDVNNLGELCQTEKGLALAEKRRQKLEKKQKG